MQVRPPPLAVPRLMVTNSRMVLSSPDLEARGLALVAQVLGGESDGRKREEAVARTDLRRAFDGDMRDQFAAFAELDVCSHSAVGADFAGWSEFSQRDR